MRRLALAEFQASLTAANAPLDRFARGEHDAMTEPEKRGALLFFGKAGCVGCHAVSGAANEMFSDFKPHRIGGPQVVPSFGAGSCNVIFDGPDEMEDYGFEQVKGDPALRYTFRTAPLRNLKVSPAFFHNGAFATLRAAILHHFQPESSLESYDPVENELPEDIVEAPFDGILAAGLDPDLPKTALSADELEDLVAFLETGLLDPKVLGFCELVPESVPSGASLPKFQDCP